MDHAGNNVDFSLFDSQTYQRREVFITSCKKYWAFRIKYKSPFKSFVPSEFFSVWHRDKEEILVSIGLEQKKLAIFWISDFGNNPSFAEISVLPHPILQSSLSVQILAEVKLLIPSDKT